MIRCPLTQIGCWMPFMRVIQISLSLNPPCGFGSVSAEGMRCPRIFPSPPLPPLPGPPWGMTTFCPPPQRCLRWRRRRRTKISAGGMHRTHIKQQLCVVVCCVTPVFTANHSAQHCANTACLNYGGNQGSLEWKDCYQWFGKGLWPSE